MTWPYLGDSPNAIIRRVCHAYRATLQQCAPEECAELDRRMIGLGQKWVVPQLVTVDPDDWLTPAEAADYACIELDSIRQMRRRGRLTGRKVGKHWQYQAREIEAAFMGLRGRTGAKTDTMPTSTSAST